MDTPVRDETELVPIVQTSPDPGSILPEFATDTIGPVPVGLKYPWKTTATEIFFTRYALQRNPTKSARSHLDHLVPMYLDAPPDSLLQKATHAAALAALSNLRETPELLVSARREYGRAIRDVEKALNDPVAAKSDEVLMSVLLFAFYEVRTRTHLSMRSESSSPPTSTHTHSADSTKTVTLTGTSSTRSKLSWAYHINGAVSLIKMRGEEQLHNPRSLQLFRAVRAFMVIHKSKTTARTNF